MEYKVNELAKINEYSLKKGNFPNQIKYLDTANITKGVVDNVVSLDTRNDKIPSRARRVVRNNDIIISTVRPNQEHYGYIKDSHSDLIVSTGFAVLTPKKDLVNPYYLYLALTTDKMTKKLQNIAEDSTSAYPSIKPSVIGEQIIKLPSIKTQNNIGTFISNIDKKIGMNNKIIANLEELSQTLFKRWFVDFEFSDDEGRPYKSSGGKMIDSQIGPIPLNWEVTSLKDTTIKFTTGLNPRKNFVLGEGSNYYVTIKNMSNNNIILDDKCDKVTDEALKIINKRSDLKIGDVLFSGIGTIGRTYLIYKEPYNWNTSESVFSLRPSSRISSVYLFYLLLSDEVQDYSRQMASGSVQKGVRKRDLERYMFAISTSNIEKKFHKLVTPLQNKIHNLREQNLLLKELRDTLLPKLMSGEIELSDDVEVEAHAELLQ